MATRLSHAPGALARDARRSEQGGRARGERTRYEPYRSALLSPQRVRELSRLRPGRAVADAALCWLSIVAAWLAVALWPTWWMTLLAIPLVGARYYGLFIIGHDGLHRRLFPRRRQNDLFNDLAILGPIGAITRVNGHNHLAHHDRLATDGDPDRHRHGCANKADRTALLGYLTGVTSILRSAKNVFAGNAVMPNQAEHRVAGASYRTRDVSILVGWQLALVTGLTWGIGWWAYPALWVAPIFLFTILGDNLRSFLEHSHPEADALADRHRLITFLSHPLERAFIAPMNMNYHAAHHLWPSIPYYNLPQADREIRAGGEATGLIWRGSYLEYLWRYFCALPLDACRKVARSADRVDADPRLSSPDAGRALDVPPGELARPAVPLIHVEAVPACPVCQATSSAPYAVGFDYEMLTCRNAWRFVRCDACGHVWLNPRPDVSALPVIYPNEYYAYNYQQLSPVALRGKALLDRLKLRSILKYLTSGPSAYLDVGCGDGRYLRAIERTGLPRDRLFGVELDPRTVEGLAAQGYRVLCARVEACDDLPDATMDLITMFHVIEHVDDPGHAVERMRRWLAPGGILALETPNLNSLDARLFRRSWWGGYHIPRHWNLFTAESLARLLTDRGLEILAVRYQTGHSFWMYSFHHALRFGRRRFPRLARAFDPLRSLPLLILFTVFDKMRAALGFRTSSVLVIARRPASG